MPYADPAQQVACKHRFYLAHQEEMKERARKHYADHREERKEKRKQQYRTNSEAAIRASKDYYEKHKDEILTAQKELRANDPVIREIHNRKTREWKKRNPEMVVLHSIQRKTRKLNAF